MANNDSGYTKKCKHFLMVLNYIKEQIALGQIEARKIYGKLNTADMHTKPLRSSEFLTMAHKILGQPSPPQQPAHTLPTPPPLSETVSCIMDTAEKVSCIMDMNAKSQPGNEAKRSLPAGSALTPNAKRRKAHILRFITRSASDSTMDADVYVPAV